MRRAAEYEAFARDVSLPMFRRQPGFRDGAIFRRGEECVMMTLLQDIPSVANLTRSETYAQTIRDILARVFLHGEQAVNAFDLHLLADLPSLLASSPP